MKDALLSHVIYLSNFPGIKAGAAENAGNQ